MSDPLATFIAAYQCLYESPAEQSNNQSVKQAQAAAHTWLLSFQSDPAAWTVVDRVLNTPSSNQADNQTGIQSINPGCHYLAATILLTKIRYHFADLSSMHDARSSLRQSIIGQIQRFQSINPSGNQSIISRLSLCLAALSVREMADGLWPTCIQDLTTLFLNHASNQANAPPIHQSISSFLSIVKELPEEANNIKLHMADAARTRAQDMLQTSLQSMLDLLWSIYQSVQQSLHQSISKSVNENNQQLCIECLSSWLKNLRFDPLAFINHPLSAVPFQSCLIDRLSECSEECCMEIIERSAGTNARNQLYTLLQPIQVHYQSNYQSINQDRETGLMITKLLCTFAETDAENITEILGNQSIDQSINQSSSHTYVNPINHQEINQSNIQSIKNLLDTILLTCLHEDKDIGAYSFKFWTDISFCVSHRLGEAIREAKETNNHSNLSFSDAPFMPYFMQVVKHVHAMVLFPKNFQSISQSDKEALKKYRYLASDTLKNLVQVASKNPASNQSIGFWLQIFYDALNAGKQTFVSSSGAVWQDLEAALHCFRAIGEALPLNEPTVIPQVMNFILGDEQSNNQSINQSIISGNCPSPLSYTCLLVVSKYADWIATHQEHYLSRALQLVVQSLNGQSNQAAAAVAFKNLCEANDDYMVESINQLSSSQSSNSQSIYGALFGVFNASTSLHMDDQREIIGGVCHVVSKLNNQSINQSIKALIEPTAQTLDAAINQSNGPSIDLYLDRLSDIYAELNPSSGAIRSSNQLAQRPADSFRSAVSASTIQIYPIITKGLQHLVDTEKRAEQLCRILKYAFRNCSYELRSLFDSLIDCLIDCFERYPYSAFIYLIATLIDLYGDNQSNSQELQIIQRSFARLGGRVVQLFNSIQPITQSINQFPDVHDDFMDLCYRLLIKNPNVLLESTFTQSNNQSNNQISSQLCPFLLQLALAGLTTQHPKAFNQSCRFLSMFFDEATGSAKMRMARTGLTASNNQTNSQSVALHFAHAISPSVALAILRAVCYDQPIARQTVLAELAMSLQLVNHSNKIWTSAFASLANEYATHKTVNTHWVPASESVQNDFITILEHYAIYAQQVPPIQALHCQRQVKDALYKLSGACRIK